MNKCRDESEAVKGDLDGLGHQLVFKRADLPGLLAKQRAFNLKKEQDELVTRLKTKKRSVEDHLKQRSFVAAQIELFDCINSLQDCVAKQEGEGLSELKSIKADLLQIKKVPCTCRC